MCLVELAMSTRTGLNLGSPDGILFTASTEIELPGLWQRHLLAPELKKQDDLGWFLSQIGGDGGCFIFIAFRNCALKGQNAPVQLSN